MISLPSFPAPCSRQPGFYGLASNLVRGEVAANGRSDGARAALGRAGLGTGSLLRPPARGRSGWLGAGIWWHPGDHDPPDCSSQPDAVSEMSNQAHLSLIGWMQRHEQRRSTPLPILLCACPRPHKSSIQHQKHRAPKTPQKGRDHAKCNSLSSACNYRGRRPAAAQPSPAGAGAGAHVLLIQLALP